MLRLRRLLRLRMLVLPIGILLLLGILVSSSISLSIIRSAKSSLFLIDDVPSKQAILILGAKVHPSGEPSAFLRDRLETGLALYKAKKAPKIIVSGDHGQKTYDEVNAMRTYLTERDVPKEDIFMDHAGFDTYDSMYRARDIFEVESLIITTQTFHLPRAIFLARSMGIDAVGVAATGRQYPTYYYIRQTIREPLARIKAVLDVVRRRQPKYLGPAIPITGDGTQTEG